MNDNRRTRREWVKTVAIIFLSVLLLLTFFSNTIMNYSLPEVATESVESGTITAKIRGMGIVESEDPYEIKITAARTIESVRVEEGDTVEKGDVIFLLADEEDENLALAKEELELAEKTYEAAVKNLELNFLIGSISKDVYNNLDNGKVTSFSDYKAQMEAVEAEIEKYQNLKTELTTTQTNLEKSSPDVTAEQTAYNKAQDAFDEKYEDLVDAKEDLESMETELKEAKDLISDVENEFVTVSGSDAEAELEAAQKKVELLPDKIKELKSDIKDLQAEVDELEDDMNEKSAILDDKQNNTTLLENVEKGLADAETKYDEAVATREKIISSIQAEYGDTYDLETPYEDLLDAREKVLELQQKSIGVKIEAPISGTIESIEVVAGDKTGDGVLLATMQPEGRGYTMSFSVTNEQAKRLSVGDIAEITNSWKYDDVDIILDSIKPDPDNANQMKLLTFEVNGSVTAGQSFNVSVGQKSADYDLIVPNSAIKEDNNGKFVLVLEMKSSPLGNRYYASRADIQVIASDDTRSAVSGALYSSDYVITTSTQPVEEGQLVRLANN